MIVTLISYSLSALIKQGSYKTGASAHMHKILHHRTNLLLKACQTNENLNSYTDVMPRLSLAEYVMKDYCSCWSWHSCWCLKRSLTRLSCSLCSRCSLVSIRCLRQQTDLRDNNGRIVSNVSPCFPLVYACSCMRWGCHCVARACQTMYVCTPSTKPRHFGVDEKTPRR